MLRFPQPLDELDPPLKLGPPLRLAAVVLEPDDPKPLPHNPGIWKRADGKLETHIEPPPRPPGTGRVSRDMAGLLADTKALYGGRQADWMIFDDLCEDEPRPQFPFSRQGTMTGRFPASELARWSKNSSVQAAKEAQSHLVGVDLAAIEQRLIASWQARNGGPAIEHSAKLTHMTPSERFVYSYFNSEPPRDPRP